MKDVFDAIIETFARGEKAALSTIVSSRGSLPMSKKAKMLVREDGTFVGTVGGGCLEADVWAEARQVMASGTPSLQRFILTEKHAGEEGLNCGGNAEIFTEPVCPGPLEELFHRVRQLQETRGTGMLATLVSGPADTLGRKMLVTETGEQVGTLGDPLLDARVRENKERTTGEDLLSVLYLEHHGVESRIFVEAILPAPQLVLFGGGHVSKAIARIAKTVGFRIVVVEDRPTFASPERFPEADQLVICNFDSVIGKLAIDTESYLVAVTRGHQWDQTIIEQVAWTSARYIGMIGSRRKIALMWKKLEEKGIPRPLLNRIHAPVGLDIHADTPEEIAVSVVAQLIQVRRSQGKPAHSTAEAPSDDRQLNVTPAS